MFLDLLLSAAKVIQLGQKLCVCVFVIQKNLYLLGVTMKYLLASGQLIN